MRIREFAEDGMDINARLEKLERENRRTKKIGIVAIVFASVLFVSGQAKTNKVVEANEFRLVDNSGNLRASLDITHGQAELQFSSLSVKPDVILGADAKGGPFLIMGRGTGKGTASLTPEAFLLDGSSGKFNILLGNEGGEGPSLTIEDNEGYSSVLGSSNLVQTKTGKKEQTPAASLVLFGKDKKVLWSAP
jgi:hypothetical protein